MSLRPSTTLDELQLEFGKLGIDSFVWNVLAGIHSITLIGDDGRVQGFGRDFVNALGDSLARYAEKMGLIIIMERSRPGEPRNRRCDHSQVHASHERSTRENFSISTGYAAR